MKRTLAGTVTALAVFVMSSQVYAATTIRQATCPFGRTFAGECIKQATAELIRWSQTAARVYTQDRISATSALVLPREDRIFPRSYDFYLLRSGQ